MKRKLFQSQLLTASLAIMLGACSNENIPLGQLPDTEDGVISFEIGIPSSDKLNVENGYTRTVGDEIDDENFECAVKTVDIYVFKRNSGSSDDYTYHKKYPFSISGSNQLNGTENTDGLAGSLNGSTSMKCNIAFEESFNNQELYFVFVANDPEITEPTSGSKLSAFRNTVATAVATADENGISSCESLIGHSVSTDENGVSSLTMGKGFAMSAEAKTDGVVSHTGENFSVKLVRNVARIDIQNNTPNLEIIGLRLAGVNSKSCILADENNGINIPADADTLSLRPLATMTLPFAYVSKDNAGNPLSEAALADANTKTSFYLYERDNTAEEFVKLYITYRLMYSSTETGEGDIYQENTVEVKFADNSGVIDVTRNTLYKIIVGDGTERKTTVAEVTVVPQNWTFHRLDHQINITENQ